MVDKANNVTKIDIPAQAFCKKFLDLIYRNKTITTDIQARGFGVRFRHRRTETVTQIEKPT